MVFKIFVSYNPDSEIEQSTALRLQTLSSLYGAVVHLPDRLGSNKLKDSTKQSVLDSQVFVMFSTTSLSNVVNEEVNYALKNNKRVVIFYDKVKGKNLDTSNIQNNNLIETQFDPETDNAANVLLEVMKHGGFVEKNQPESQKSNNGIGALVGVGLGLLLLWGLSKDDEEHEN